MKKLIISILLLIFVLSCSIVLASPYSVNDDTRHLEICIDLTQAWYDAWEVGNVDEADYIYQILDDYNNYLVSDSEAIAIIQEAKN